MAVAVKYQHHATSLAGIKTIINFQCCITLLNLQLCRVIFKVKVFVILCLFKVEM